MAGKQLYKSALILGAGSDMARPLLDLLFTNWDSCEFYLLARNPGTLQALKDAGEARGHRVRLVTYDLLSPTDINLTGVECCITFAGWLPPDNSEPVKTMEVNATAIQQFTEKLIATNIDSLKHIIITGSIAGVRVRPSNRAYGAAKSALHQWARKLQKEQAGTIDITLVIPGYVKTKMIRGMQTPSFLTLSPQHMAEKYYQWIYSRPAIVYSQPAWKMIARILRAAPEFLVKRMKS